MSKEPLWKIGTERLKHNGGRPRVFTRPEDMMAAALEYFKWVDANPLYEYKAFNVQGQVVVEPVPKMQAMTLAGFWVHAGFNRQTWYNYLTKPEYLEVMQCIEETIRNQKFVGAAADLLNANIIARDLGLADKSEISGPNGGPIRQHTEVSDEDLAQKLKELGFGRGSGQLETKKAR